jgi:CDGSH-type Zn-finger protein/ferredoxin
MKANITAISNGPLVVKSDDNDKIIYKDGKKFHAPSPAYLCRCGASKKKPFCDGSHQSISFSDAKQIKKEEIQEYQGKTIKVIFNRSICAGAANCVNMLPEVFSEDDSANWIHPDEADKESIIQIIKTCPSGALSYSVDDKVHVDTRTTSKINILKDGPYLVEALEFKTPNKPTNFSPTKFTLCRCGNSANMPYCDYSHADMNWKG